MAFAVQVHTAYSFALPCELFPSRHGSEPPSTGTRAGSVSSGELCTGYGLILHGHEQQQSERCRPPRERAILQGGGSPRLGPGNGWHSPRRPSVRRRNAAMAERRTQPLQVILAADELAAVEEFRFQARMPEPIGCGSRTSKTGAGSCVSWRRSPNAPFARLEMLTASGVLDLRQPACRKLQTKMVRTSCWARTTSPLISGRST